MFTECWWFLRLVLTHVPHPSFSSETGALDFISGESHHLYKERKILKQVSSQIEPERQIPDLPQGCPYRQYMVCEGSIKGKRGQCFYFTLIDFAILWYILQNKRHSTGSEVLILFISNNYLSFLGQGSQLLPEKKLASLPWAPEVGSGLLQMIKSSPQGAEEAVPRCTPLPGV